MAVTGVYVVDLKDDHRATMSKEMDVWLNVPRPFSDALFTPYPNLLLGLKFSSGYPSFDRVY
jgi:hypothetical protein